MKPTYTALYRRWRPQLFSQVVGQEHVTRTLQNALEGDRIAHAYLFCGLRGTGKTTMAKLLAKALNCQEGVHAEPCNRCIFCREITGGRNMDVQEIDAASNRGIDEIRELREKVRYASASSRYKVYIIDEVHMLTNEAFNALLKTLEEPPPRVVFILATTETHKLPLTVVSRCQRFDFHLLETRQVAGRLREVAGAMDFQIDDESLFLLARQAEGSLRDAMGFLEQCRAYGGEEITHRQVLDILGLASPEAIYRLMESIVQEDIQAGLAEIKEIVFRGRDLHRFLKEMLLYLRKLMLLQVGEKEDSVLDDVPALKPYLTKHDKKIDHRAILEMMEIIQDLTYQLKGASQPHFLFELAFLRLVRAYRFRRYLDPADLLSRLEELEEKLQSAQNIKRPVLGAGEEETAASAERSAPEAKASPASRLEEDFDDTAYMEPPPEPGQDDPAVSFPGDSGRDQKGSAQSPVREEIEAPGPETPDPKSIGPKQTPAKKAIDLEKMWAGQVIPGLKKRRQSQATYLLGYLESTKAAPVSWKDGIFTVGVDPSAGKLLVKRLEDQENRKILTSLLQELLGTPVEVRFILRQAAGKETADEETPESQTRNPGDYHGKDAAKSEDPKKSGQSDYYIKEMLELFNGQLIQTNGDSLDSLEYWSYASPPPPGEEREEDPLLNHEPIPGSGNSIYKTRR